MLRYIRFIGVFAFLFGAVGCFKDLNTTPTDPDEFTSEAVYKDPASYKKVLAKLYGGYALSGQQGPAGNVDISGIDEGFGQYLRGYWYHQELPTDEAVIGWNDQTIKNFHAQTWTAADGFIYAFYSRVFYQVALVNEFLRETTDEKLAARNVDAALKSEIKRYRAEARFLRALSYWHGLDLFRNTPFALEDKVVGSFLPEQTNATALFNFIESELLTIDADLAAPRANEYGRVDKAAAWMLLAKLYLNAEVYEQTPRYDKCLEYCDKLIGSSYELDPEYKNLFLADNHNSKEVIFPITFDGINTRTYGGTTFIIRAGIGGNMDETASGVVSGWGGTRTTRQFVEKFPTDLTGIKIDFNPRENLPNLYIPGSHQNFDLADTDNSLSSNSSTETKKFEGHIYFPNPNTEFFFTRIPSPGGPKFGDNDGNGTLENNGANIKVADAGYYYIKADLGAKTYSVTKQSWSVAGTAIGPDDKDMVYDPATKLWTIEGQFTAGTFKFRANKDAAQALGDSDGDAILKDTEGEITLSDAGGYRITLDIKKPEYTYQIASTDFDRRGMFFTDGQNLDIEDLTVFTEGYAINKFKNVTSTGMPGKDTEYPDTDFPMFRLADAYLMAAEAVLRGAAGGDKAKAVGYFNKVRQRAYKGNAGNYLAADLNLGVILDERARELYWECHRRTDLVRFGQFTNGTYNWAWKGGVKEGQSVEDYRDIYPIPTDDLSTNPNLKQNPKY
jgi:SusD family